MARAGEVARALVSRRWLWVTLTVLAMMALLARLGIWQLDRLEQRRAANAQLLEAIESAPIDLNAEFRSYADLTPATVPAVLAPVFALGFGPDHLLTNDFRLSYLQDAEAHPDGGFPLQSDNRPPAAPEKARAMAGAASGLSL